MSKFAANDQKMKIPSQVESPIMSPRIPWVFHFGFYYQFIILQFFKSLF